MSTTPNYNWPLIEPTDFVTNLPADLEDLADAIDATVFANDAAALKATIIDAKGDLLVGTAADTINRLGVGSNGQVLIADSGETTGLKWGTPAGGKILQVVSAVVTAQNSTSSGSYVDSDLTVSITPSNTNSKVLVFVALPTASLSRSGSQTVYLGQFRLVRDSTALAVASLKDINVASSTGRGFGSPVCINYLDSPNTTSATTYKIQFQVVAADSVFLQDLGSGTGGAATIIALEVGQ